MTAKPEFQPATSPTGDPLLLTPGPLTTLPEVKQAMLHDYGSRDESFIAFNAGVRDRLVDIIHGADTFDCVPLQGSGTFVVEAMLTTFLATDSKLLILVNGAYGKRMAKICEYHDINVILQEAAEDTPVDPAELDRRLAADPAISHVAVVHCETTTGVLNPIQQVADIVTQHGRSLLIDAMSAFGAIELDARETAFDAVVASSNKCLEGLPGMGFCLARRDALQRTQGNCDTLCLDLYDQWQRMEQTKQWRFTPPVQCIVSFAKALDIFEAEGGVAGRGGRYRDNCRILVNGMRELGFESLLPDALQAPIIITFHTPADPQFEFQKFYDLMKDQGYIIYPGKLTVAETFRMGCIGRLGAEEMQGALQAVRRALVQMGVTHCAPEAIAVTA